MVAPHYQIVEAKRQGSGYPFRGNAEATIRQSFIDKGFIKGIIGLPVNLFYGTGIPACIIVIDKEIADERTVSL